MSPALHRLVLLLATSALVLVSCSEGSREDESDAAMDTSITDTGTYCDAAELEIAYTPSNILFLLDRSASMMGPRWNAVSGALRNTLEIFDNDEFYFGYHVFPSFGSTCGIAPNVRVDVAPGNLDLILEKHVKSIPNGSTPLYCALLQFLDDDNAPEFSSNGLDSYLVVMSDGDNVCPTNCPAVSHLGLPQMSYTEIAERLLEKGLHTIVIGFGHGGAGSGALSQLSKSGGTFLDKPIYAASKDTIGKAFEEIMLEALSCRFEIDPDVVDSRPESVALYLEDELIPHDDNCANDHGWTWSDDQHSEVVLCDHYCSKLKTNLDQVIGATFGCASFAY